MGICRESCLMCKAEKDSRKILPLQDFSSNGLGKHRLAREVRTSIELRCNPNTVTTWHHATANCAEIPQSADRAVKWPFAFHLGCGKCKGMSISSEAAVCKTCCVQASIRMTMGPTKIPCPCLCPGSIVASRKGENLSMNFVERCPFLHSYANLCQSTGLLTLAHPFGLFRLLHEFRVLT